MELPSLVDAPEVDGRPFRRARNGGNTMAGNGRKQDGTFAVGNAGGPGRPPRMIERTYLIAMSDRVTVDDWEAIVGKAVEQAKAGDATARAWLGNHLLPPAPSATMPWPLRGARLHETDD